ncbi:AAA family ATPase [Bacillus infantis]|uniref:ParA family protein n=1 Tax=Bacillus infantis TaxID=324767 RepID=UPI001CD40CAB|nr:AAA family ATPase [Bacillus infantis]MCA1037476.1 AAA family ATPase [Bacillus infantis]HER2025569.1 AAA family ATPase [Streptococcus pyogenes]
MAKIITIGLQKGGVGKTTTAGTLCYLLAEDGYKVLGVDMDSQSNLSNLLTQHDDTYFEGSTVLEAIEDGEVEPYIYKVTENLHVLPSDDYLATLAKFLYTEWKGRNQSLALRELLDQVRDKYDYIIIDTPPSLSEPMVNAICASDYVVVLAESSKWAFNAIPRFLETVEFSQQNINPNLKVAGILRTMNDVRRADSKAFVEVIGEEYPELCFDVVIRRKASTGRISLEGLFDNKELNQALDQYQEFYKELLQRV